MKEDWREYEWKKEMEDRKEDEKKSKEEEEKGEEFQRERQFIIDHRIFQPLPGEEESDISYENVKRFMRSKQKIEDDRKLVDEIDREIEKRNDFQRSSRWNIESARSILPDYEYDARPKDERPVRRASLDILDLGDEKLRKREIGLILNVLKVWKK